MIKKLKEAITWWLYKGLYKPGHYYSPIPSIKEIEKNADVIFTGTLPQAICLRQEQQKKLLERMKGLLHDFDWPENLSPSHRYYHDNIYFNRADAFVLHAMLRLMKPKRIIEIGSGFSSVLMMDTNEKYLDGGLNLTLIEPFPDRLGSLMRLKDSSNPKYDLVKEFIQKVPLDTFGELEENDILFVDSSHISKMGSDLNHIIFNILPKLKVGVLIHFHDVTFPFEYPYEWVKDGVYWNEIYILRAFLMYNKSYEIVLMNHLWKDTELNQIPVFNKGGGSLWIRKTGM